MLNVVVMVSGGGTNLQAIIDAVHSGKITNTRIAGVISINQNAYALTRAEVLRSAFLLSSFQTEQNLTVHCLMWLMRWNRILSCWLDFWL